MNGAHALIRTLVDSGVDVCFANPGTSEMHFVAALDTVPEMRAVLALFEGVATGAADGYSRMADAPGPPCCTWGPGLGNGLANLHNARRAKVPIVNIVGDHATYHAQYDAPLQSDIETVAHNVSTWVRTARRPEDLSSDAIEAVTAAHGPPGQVATLILPADVSWSDGAEPASSPALPAPRAPSEQVVDTVAQALRNGHQTGMLLGGQALRERRLASGRSGRSGNRHAAAQRRVPDPATARRGTAGGRPDPVLPEAAMSQLDGLDHLILVDAKAPASFFAYPDSRSYLVPDGCEVHELASASTDAVASLEALVDALDAAGARPALQQAARPRRPAGPLDAEKVCQAVGAMLPEGAILSDEGVTSGMRLPANTAGAPRHDWLTLTGGAIGQGLPVAVGAAVACPDRPVFALQADGSGLYTIQSWWTMARERLT